MKKNIFLLIFIFFLTLNLNAQTEKRASVEVVKEKSDREYVIDPQPLLEQYHKQSGKPEIDAKTLQSNFKKVSSWNFLVGDKKSFYNYSYSATNYYQTAFTCRAVGTNCYIFVEDSSYTKYFATDAQKQYIDSVRIYFDSKTPANPNKGIYWTDVDNFGNPPDVDGDHKIIILIQNIQDSYDGATKKGYTAGFFDSWDETGQNGNSSAEIYHLDCYPGMKDDNALKVGLSTTAHEFQHMIHWNYHSSGQPKFFNEGCSLIAEVINGFPVYAQNGYYNSEPNHYLFDWRSNTDPNIYNDYSRAARFMLYLREQFDPDGSKFFFKRFVQSSNTGVTALDNNVFPNVGTTRRTADIAVDWWVANYLNDKSFDPKYGYTYQNLGKPESTIITDPNVIIPNGIQLNKEGVSYVSYIAGKNLSVNFNNGNKSSIKVKAIKIGSSGKQVVDVNTNQNVAFYDFGTTYNEITFAVYHGDLNEFTSGPFPVTYNSTGTKSKTVQELSNDQNQNPVGVWAGNVGDTVAVTFSGIQGASLDSIKVALRQAGSINGSVSQYNSTWNPSALKKSTSIPFTATSTIATRPPSPYPVPWPNWVKVDLTSSNIDASNDFVVAFYIQGVYNLDGSGANGLLYSLVSGQSFSGSMTFDNNPSSGLPRWIWYVNNSNQTYVYLIRAYVSYGGTTGVKDVIELMPSSFKLAQNYPNPFNPSTVINYQLPVSGHVSLKVYDMLGREVATLVDEFQPAGSYVKTLHATSLPSGVYFYTIKAGNFIETKKMVLMK